VHDIHKVPQIAAMNNPRLAIIVLVAIGVLLVGVAWQRYQKCLSLGGGNTLKLWVTSLGALSKTLAACAKTPSTLLEPSGVE
jgi:hypothetical protein